MIKLETNEYSKDGVAIRVTQVTIFNIPVYKFKEMSTNKDIVNQLTVTSKPNKVKGFKNEVED